MLAASGALSSRLERSAVMFRVASSANLVIPCSPGGSRRVARTDMISTPNRARGRRHVRPWPTASVEKRPPEFSPRFPQLAWRQSASAAHHVFVSSTVAHERETSGRPSQNSPVDDHRSDAARLNSPACVRKRAALLLLIPVLLWWSSCIAAVQTISVLDRFSRDVPCRCQS